MTVKIDARFTPLRMRLKYMDPVELQIVVTNTGQRERPASIKIMLSGQLSFDKSGLKTGLTERLDKLDVGKPEKFYYLLYPKPHTRPGSKEIRILVQEHGKTIGEILKETNKNTALQVE